MAPRAQWRLSSTSAESASVIEMLFRLGVALLLSLSLALLLAWGWDRSDAEPPQPPAPTSEPSGQPAPLH